VGEIDEAQVVCTALEVLGSAPHGNTASAMMADFWRDAQTLRVFAGSHMRPGRRRSSRSNVIKQGSGFLEASHGTCQARGLGRAARKMEEPPRLAGTDESMSGVRDRSETFRRGLRLMARTTGGVRYDLLLNLMPQSTDRALDAGVGTVCSPCISQGASVR